MVTYIYFVKCPNCEDEHFDFFDDAKSYAMGCMSQKPIITQTEVCRNDFGECTDSADLGTVWSWEDAIGEPEVEPTTFSKDDIGDYNPDNDPEFQDYDFFAVNSEELDEELTEEFDRVKAAAQCSKKCYDFYNAVATNAPEKELKKHGKVAYKFVKDQFGLTGKKAEDLLISGYAIWRLLNGKSKYESLTEATAAEFDEIMKLCKEIGIETGADLDKFVRDEVKSDETLLTRLRSYRSELGDEFQIKETLTEAAVLTGIATAAASGVIVDVVKRIIDKFGDRKKKSKWINYKKYIIEQNPEGQINIWNINGEQIFSDLHTIDAAKQKIKTLPDPVKDRKPVPEGMTIKQLKETMEENEDMVECAGCEELFPKDECFHKEGIGWVCGDCEDRIVKCTWCDELYDKGECRYEVDLGWLCDRCEAAIKSRGETLTFREGNYWDFLDEEVEPKKHTWACYLNGKDVGTVEAATEEEAYREMEKSWDINNEDAQVVLEDELDEEFESKELHDLGNEYDGGYPAETPEVSDSHLKLCPECGKETFDIETGICIECGFN